MTFGWQWPWVAAAGMLAAVLIMALVLIVGAWRRKRSIKRMAGSNPARQEAHVFSLDDDLNTEHASRLFRQWRWLNRLLIALLTLALAVALSLLARPSTVARDAERTAGRDIILCLDVSGSALPYDREVIETYLDLVSRFQGERIGLSIFNSTSRTVFPLTDDYELVTSQLESARDTLRGVESQDDIESMSDADYQQLSDWLEGTQNRRDTTSLIGDGLVSCAAMLPGFAYGSAPTDGNGNDGNGDGGRLRAASIVLATDNVVSGEPTYTLDQALELTSQASISVDGLFSGPEASEGEETTKAMQRSIEAHGGMFVPRSQSRSVEQLVRDIDRRRQAEDQSGEQAAMVDAPGWWTLALAVLTAGAVLTAWRLRR